MGCSIARLYTLFSFQKVSSIEHSQPRSNYPFRHQDQALPFKVIALFLWLTLLRQRVFCSPSIGHATKEKYISPKHHISRHTRTRKWQLSPTYQVHHCNISCWLKVSPLCLPTFPLHDRRLSISFKKSESTSKILMYSIHPSETFFNTPSDPISSLYNTIYYTPHQSPKPPFFDFLGYIGSKKPRHKEIDHLVKFWL